MNKEIKFRALKENPKEYVGGYGINQDNAKWAYGSGIVPVYINTCLHKDKLEMVVDVNYDELDYWQPSYSNCEIIPNTVCQYIGIDDKNKKEIYEGDIVRTNSGRLCKVVWFSSPQYQGRDLVPIETKNPTPKEWNLWEDLEIVGNIFDNPELLGGDYAGKQKV